MNKKSSITTSTTEYIHKEFPNPDNFCFMRKNNTRYFSPFFNLLDFQYQIKEFDIGQIRRAIIRAKQDYGKAFEKLAAED